MLKISYFHTNTHSETFAPLVTCVIDDTLLKPMPDSDQALLQFINIMILVGLLMHFSPSFVVKRIQIRAVGQPENTMLSARRRHKNKMLLF